MREAGIREGGSRIGLDPIPHCFLMENHDEAYQIWQKGSVKQRVLVHIDAHHDMGWIPDDHPITIANFICAALKEDMVSEVFWVVADQTWQSSRGLKAVHRHLKTMARKYPGSSTSPRVENGQILTTVFGKPVRVCPLGSLPCMDENTLLDIDVDFLVISRVTYGEQDKLGTFPWAWPDELVDRLRGCQIRSDLVTISYSVEGGFTPLKWKYLGDELKQRLIQPNDGGRVLQGMRLIREAALAAHQSHQMTAEKMYLEAKDLLPNSAAPCWHLAHLYTEMDRIELGQKFYRQALTLDPSYRTAYNSAGLRYYRERRFRKAEEEHKRTLTLDPNDAYAHLGLGRLAAKRKRLNEAEEFFRKSLKLDANLIDAHRALGDVLARQGRFEEAISAYEWSLKIALSGHKPLEGPILTCAEDDRRLKDPDHCQIHARLGRLYALKGNIPRAISGYRISIAGGGDGVWIRSRLAYLYLKQRQWKKWNEELFQAFKAIPMDAKKVGNRMYRRFRLALKGAQQILLFR